MKLCIRTASFHPLFHHFRHHEEMVFGGGRVPHNIVGNAAVRDHVRAFLHLHGGDRCHGLDACDVDLRQLLHEGENGVEFPLQMLDLLLGDGDACEVRDAAASGGVDGHAASL